MFSLLLKCHGQRIDGVKVGYRYEQKPPRYHAPTAMLIRLHRPATVKNQDDFFH